MKVKGLFLVIGLLSGLLLSACNGSDAEEVAIVIPTEEDEECCSLDDEVKTNRFLADYKEVTGLSGQTVGKYTIKVYARKAELYTGYNDLFFAVEKTESGRHVKDIAVSDLSPLMDMGSMKHSTPIGNQYGQVDELPVYRTWVSLLMAGEWSLPFSYRIKDTSGTLTAGKATAVAAPNGQAWVKSFKSGDDTYYITIASPQDFKTGINTVTAYVSKRGSDGTLPYLPAAEAFTVDLYPAMPDMGNHTSPNNEALTRQGDGSYQGKLNLTMTGTWNIHLHVKDAATGSTVAGGEELSDLYWTVVL